MMIMKKMMIIIIIILIIILIIITIIIIIITIMITIMIIIMIMIIVIITITTMIMKMIKCWYKYKDKVMSRFSSIPPPHPPNWFAGPYTTQWSDIGDRYHRYWIGLLNKNLSKAPRAHKASKCQWCPTGRLTSPIWKITSRFLIIQGKLDKVIWRWWLLRPGACSDYGLSTKCFRYSWTSVIRLPDIWISLLSGCHLAVYTVYFSFIST